MKSEPASPGLAWLAVIGVGGCSVVAGAFSCGATPVISLGDGSCPVPEGTAVSLEQDGGAFTLSNGLVTMTIGAVGQASDAGQSTGGQVTALSVNGTELMAPGQTLYVSDVESSGQRTIMPTAQTVVSVTAQRVELSFVDTGGAMNWDLHYVMEAGTPGFYYFLIADTIGKPPLLLPELRSVQSFDPTILVSGYNGERHGLLPSASMQASLTASSEFTDDTWELPDAAILAGTPGPEGPVYTPYDWASYMDEDWSLQGHGLYGNGFGAWLLTASPEYYSGGPMKQELMVQSGNIILNMFNGGHFGSGPITPTPLNWRKVYGPSLLYVNQGSDAVVIADAKARAAAERAKWPYCWMTDPDYPTKRGTVDGTISVTNGRSAANAIVALADPSELYVQTYGYIYWTRADTNGDFVIRGVRPGTYAVHVIATQGDLTASVGPAAAPTDAGAGASDAGADAAVNGAGGPSDTSELIQSPPSITVTAGSVHLGQLVWNPAFHARSLWEIGTSDRTSGEFAVASGSIANATPREYGPSPTMGLWDLPPANLTYTVGASTAADGWYFAQSKTGTWKVVFGLDAPVTGSDAYLTMAIAGVSQGPTLSISINGTPIFSESFMENDGTLYRSDLKGGRYQLITVPFPATYLAMGAAANTMEFNLVSGGPGSGVMYDFLKLETD